MFFLRVSTWLPLVNQKLYLSATSNHISAVICVAIQILPHSDGLNITLWLSLTETDASFLGEVH